ncbi:MAG: hypothetical protein IPO44_14645 [Candidatus Microthrix sp.]|nr:hypothetical protein [Candidatus Microthrix sp.]
MVVAGLLLALVVWGPLVLGGGGRLLDEGDAKFEAWNVDWVQHALTSSDSLFDANIFHPTPDTLAYSDTRIAPAVATLPVRWLGASPTTVLNVALYLGVVGNLRRRLVGRLDAAPNAPGQRSSGWCTPLVRCRRSSCCTST